MDKNLCVFVKMVMISLNFIWKIEKKIMVCDLLLLVVICVGLYFKINYMKKKILMFWLWKFINGNFYLILNYVFLIYFVVV